jgi:ribulose-phosphate 3-epimerase
MKSMVGKVAALKKAAPGLDIQVDGGIGRENIQVISEAGANVIVAGTSIFGAADPEAEIRHFRSIVDAEIGKAA